MLVDERRMKSIFFRVKFPLRPSFRNFNFGPFIAGTIKDMSKINPAKLVLVAMYEPSDEEFGELGVFLKDGNFKLVQADTAGLSGRLYEGEDGLLAIQAGVGNPNTAVSIMALGLAGGYDLSKAYWLISGIAGGNPRNCPLGSVVWTDWAVDGDLAFEISPEDKPEDWSTGILPIGAKEPYGPHSVDDASFGQRYEVSRLNPDLCQWAYNLTKEIPLLDSDEMKAERMAYTGFPGIQGPPQVLCGGNLTTGRYWHSRKMTEWAERWVDYWTEGEGTFYTSAMEDTGTLHALRHLSRMGLVDNDRVLLLRTASNFTFPPPGRTVIENLFGEAQGDAHYPAYIPSLENARTTATTIINEILSNWPAYWENIPTPG